MKTISTVLIVGFIGCAFAQQVKTVNQPPQNQTMITTKANLSRIFDITFGFPYQSKTELRDSGISIYTSFPGPFITPYQLTPKNPWTFTRDGQTKGACLRYMVYLTNKTKYACKVELADFRAEAVDGILDLMRRTYGDFSAPPKTAQEHNIVFVCERTPKRTITLHFRYGKLDWISFYCADIDERDRDKGEFSGKL